MKKTIKNIFKTIFFVIFILSVLFFIVEYKIYKPRPLFCGSLVEPFREKRVYLTAKAYDAHESKAYLDRDLLWTGFQPVQITIQNNTDRIYGLSTQGIGIPFVRGNKVARYVTCSAIPQSIGLKVAGFIFWPFLIPSALDSILTIHEHQKMKKDFYTKSIKDHEEWILPYSTIHRILFLPADKPIKEFPIDLIDYQTSRNHSFIVKLC